MIEDEGTPEQDEDAVAEGDAGGQDPSERPRDAADIPQDPPSDAAPEEAEEAPAEAPAEVEETEAPAEEPAAQEAPEAKAAEAPKAKDQAPGADLEPIALEPERELSAEERARLEAEEEERARLEAEAEAGDEPVARSGPQVQLSSDALIQATGKRKSSIARVILRPGSGDCQVNGRPLDEYFPRQALRTMARSPLLTAGYESSVDVQVRVHGGGIAGQAGAVRHGIARALTDVDPELRSELKRRGLLTRDARKKERRKAGLKKARKRPQFSKR
jgi:small subunit ribosomal protein S9